MDFSSLAAFVAHASHFAERRRPPPPARLFSLPCPARTRFEQATSEELEGPDWGVNVDLCDLVNSDFYRFGKDAVKALRLKMCLHTKPPVQMLALTALEMCMKNCGAQFHAMVVAKDVLVQMKRLLLGARCELEVRNKMLELVEEWAAQLRRFPHYKAAYDDLLSRGLEFPGADVAAAPPLHTPQRSTPRGVQGLEGLDEADAAAIRQAVAEVEAEVAAEEAERRRAHRNGARGIPIGVPIARPTGGLPGGAVSSARSPPRGYAALEEEDTFASTGFRAQARGQAFHHSTAADPEPPAVDASTPEAIAKLKSDLVVAANSVAVLRDMLDGIDPVGNPEAVHSEAVSELCEQCRQMQPRVVALVQSVSDEALLMAALTLNDDLSEVREKRDALVAAAGTDPESRAAIEASMPRADRADERTEEEHGSASAVDPLGAFAAAAGAPPAQQETDPFNIGLDLVEPASDRDGPGQTARLIVPPPVSGGVKFGSPPLGSPPMSRGPASAPSPVPPLAPPPGSSASVAAAASVDAVTLDDLLGPMPEASHALPADPFAPASVQSSVEAAPRSGLSAGLVDLMGPSRGSSGVEGSNPFERGGASLPPPPANAGTVNPLFEMVDGVNGMSIGSTGVGGTVSDPFTSYPLSAPPPSAGPASSAARPTQQAPSSTNPFLNVAPQQ